MQERKEAIGTCPGTYKSWYVTEPENVLFRTVPALTILTIGNLLLNARSGKLQKGSRTQCSDLFDASEFEFGWSFQNGGLLWAVRQPTR